ncbi:MAG: UDP-N-acetylglucosamine 2-epimerase (non-hydrolyzing) [Candidatus Magnetomorum sp.]|nr:UDP-N-acetylglucosamine 2-epimerase (non-hydrolyzing) [Candidatus Magnetomorum sp.]
MTQHIKKIHLIAAARPNFMKIAPLYHSLKKQKWARPEIIHTGQHYDPNMSDAFFRDLNLPSPDYHLNVGSGSHAEQTGQVMIAYERLLMDQQPDLVVVVGDVNSTLAASLAAVKLEILVAHLEAGLRSFDHSMPEEINRICTDHVCHRLWTPSPDGDKNLIAEGIPQNRIERVGNIMIDAIELTRSRIEAEKTVHQMNLFHQSFGIVTLHRPANVDRHHQLENIIQILLRLSEKMPLVFSVHPRTEKQLKRFQLLDSLKNCTNIILTPPMAYIPFMNLIFHTSMVITDSGGLQEETTYLGVPCLTIRPNTERPITIEQGTNRLCTVENLESEFYQALEHPVKYSKIPELWDGKTANRVVQSIHQLLKPIALI